MINQKTRGPKHYSNFDRTDLSSFDRTTTFFHNSVDKCPQIRFLIPDEMNTMFTKQINLMVPANGCLTRWQHKSRQFGVVGMKT